MIDLEIILSFQPYLPRKSSNPSLRVWSSDAISDGYCSCIDLFDSAAYALFVVMTGYFPLGHREI